MSWPLTWTVSLRPESEFQQCVLEQFLLPQHQRIRLRHRILSRPALASEPLRPRSSNWATTATHSAATTAPYPDAGTLLPRPFKGFFFQRDIVFQLALRLNMHRIAATLAVVGALLFSAGSAWADWDDAVAAFERGDFATVLLEWQSLAEQGHAPAHHNVSQMYYQGKRTRPPLKTDSVDILDMPPPPPTTFIYSGRSAPILWAIPPQRVNRLI